MTRTSDVLDARAAADEWAAAHALPPSGGYSGAWYQDGYLGGWWPAGWLKWWAAYGIPAGSIIGDDIVAHQYGSTPVDLDVMLDSEIVTGGTPPVDDAERQQLQNTINGLVSSLGYISSDLLAPVAKQKAGSKAVQRLVAGIRDQAEQHNIQHA